MDRKRLEERLQAEFCPPLDSSLLAALIADLDTGHHAISQLRHTLAILAHQSLITDQLDILQLSDDSTSALDSSIDTPSTSASSSTFRSPLAFLHAAFPHLPPDRLREALGDPHADPDMEALVDALLTEDYVRECHERGLEDDAFVEPSEWHLVARTSKDTNLTKKNKAKPRAKPIALVDIRQTQHLRPPAPAPVDGAPRAAGDPWVQLTSLSTHLSSLLPPHPPALFLSFFHSPAHESPATALRAALASLAPSHPPPRGTLLPTLLDILASAADYPALPAPARAQLASDAALALAAAAPPASADTALDLVWLLRDLERDPAMGIHHSPALPPPPPPPASPSTARTPRAPTHAHAPPRVTARAKPPPAPNQPGAWHTVQARGRAPPPLAVYIPAYDPPHGPRRAKHRGATATAAHATMSGGGGGGGAAERYRAALREASRQWQRGNAKTRGGEVAFYFAERARGYREEARRMALDVARRRVASKRFAGTETDTIDLHGTTSGEAVAIVRDVLSEGWASPARPLKIITGRGSHSAGRVGVLGPCVKNALDGEGWNVARWDAGLVVRGRV